MDHDPAAASAIVGRLLALGYSLEHFPSRGRPSGRCRELTTVPPYVLRYSVADDLVRILSIRHGRRRPLAD
ncbi:type II toxin-antitoxin system RelE/ParE family toxin [Roseomonas aeriglobus]|nr:type II toxin-antitoxin system RelE/ParE family toxin [Roseomonas aeriglobus]